MKKTNKLNIFIILSIILFAVIAYFANYSCVFKNFDSNTIVFFHNLAIKHSLKIPKLITNMGYGFSISVFLLALTAILGYYKKYKDAVLLNITTNTSLLATVLFKLVFHRARPAIEYHLAKADSYSFPSGHATISTCFYGTLIFLIFRLIPINWIKYFLSILLILLIFSISLSRIYLGVHYPTDVLGGIILGTFINLLWIRFYK